VRYKVAAAKEGQMDLTLTDAAGGCAGQGFDYFVRSGWTLCVARGGVGVGGGEDCLLVAFD